MNNDFQDAKELREDLQEYVQKHLTKTANNVKSIGVFLWGSYVFIIIYAIINGTFDFNNALIGGVGLGLIGRFFFKTGKRHGKLIAEKKYQWRTAHCDKKQIKGGEHASFIIIADGIKCYTLNEKQHRSIKIGDTVYIIHVPGFKGKQYFAFAEE